MAKRDPWREYRDYDPQQQWRDFDRLRGHKRLEIIVPVGRIVSAIKRLFKKEK